MRCMLVAFKPDPAGYPKVHARKIKVTEKNKYFKWYKNNLNYKILKEWDE